MRPLRERLAAGERLLCDGAMGTMLIRRGLEPGRPPESLNVTRSDVLEDVARLYVEAGADILETNTFGGSPLRLAQHGMEGEVEAVNREAVLAARRGSAGRAYVCASVGPSGRLLEPYGDVSAAALAESFARQTAALAASGVDGFVVETMTDLEEARIAVRAAKAAAPGLPVLATMTFDATPRGFFTVMGVSVEAAAAGLSDAGADAVGSNCGCGIEQMVAVAREFRRRTPLPVVIQPNAGLPRVVDGRLEYEETPAFFADRARELVALGVSLIGGCCGTTPQHVAALRAVLHSAGS